MDPKVKPENANKTIEIRRVPAQQRIDPAKEQVDVIVSATTVTEVSRKSFDGPAAMQNAEAEAKRAVEAGEAVRAAPEEPAAKK